MNNKFLSIKNWLNENNNQDDPTYGCVMMFAKIDNWEDNHLEGIDPRDIYEEEGEDYGYEEEPHVTILFGIHEDEIDPDSIISVIEDIMEPVEVEISEIDVFENEKYDVVKYNVPLDETLLKYREKFENSFLNTQTFPDYKPHITIAYVKTGEGKKYKKKLESPFKVRFNKGVYSWHNDEGELKKRIVDLEPEKEEKISSGII